RRTSCFVCLFHLSMHFSRNLLFLKTLLLFHAWSCSLLSLSLSLSLSVSLCLSVSVFSSLSRSLSLFFLSLFFFFLSLSFLLISRSFFSLVSRLFFSLDSLFLSSLSRFFSHALLLLLFLPHSLLACARARVSLLRLVLSLPLSHSLSPPLSPFLRSVYLLSLLFLSQRSGTSLARLELAAPRMRP